MFAITISPRPACFRRVWWLVAVVLSPLVVVQTVFAQTNPPTVANMIAFAEKTLETARVRCNREPTNAIAAWQFGRACFDRAEFATNDTERATLAVEGLAVMRPLVAREPKLAAAHFYLAMNIGQLARTKLLAALKLVDEMEHEFKAAHALDERFEHAGPDRNLGQLYFQAPGWPASVGSKSKARKHLERAAELAPDFPENRLNLLEAYCEWKDYKGVRRELKNIAALWPIAKTNFVGMEWASSWADWERRRKELQTTATRLLE